VPIRKLAPKNTTGAGTGFGERDIGFCFKSGKAAKAFKKKARAFAKNRKGVKVFGCEDIQF
jgi:hypothetical protein